MKKLFTISETAEMLGVATSTLRRWDEEGKFKSIRTFGNQRRYKISDIEKFIEGEYEQENND